MPPHRSMTHVGQDNLICILKTIKYNLLSTFILVFVVHDKRTSGIFLSGQRDGCISLFCKTYYCLGCGKDKFSCAGL